MKPVPSKSLSVCCTSASYTQKLRVTRKKSRSVSVSDTQNCYKLHTFSEINRSFRESDTFYGELHCISMAAMLEKVEKVFTKFHLLGTVKIQRVTQFSAIILCLYDV